MNKLMEQDYPIVQGTAGLRDELMTLVSDGDLAFRLGGQTLTLGELCREIGEIERSYIESFKTFKQDFAYRNTESGLDSSHARLTTWYKSLDDELKSVLEAFSDEDLGKTIDRGFAFPVKDQVQVYVQALLIFLAKASIYLRAMGKPLPEQWHSWIG